MTGQDAVVAQRDRQLAKLLAAHEALVQRFAKVEAERSAMAAELADTALMLAMAEQEIALRQVHARGLRQTLHQRIREVRQLQEAGQAAAEAPAPADPMIAAAELEQANRHIAQLRDELAEAHEAIRRIEGSRSWKITQPLRRVSALLGRG